MVPGLVTGGGAEAMAPPGTLGPPSAAASPGGGTGDSQDGVNSPKAVGALAYCAAPVVEAPPAPGGSSRGGLGSPGALGVSRAAGVGPTALSSDGASDDAVPWGTAPPVSAPKNSEAIRAGVASSGM